jgi:predicted nucleic acid-binding protein
VKTRALDSWAIIEWIDGRPAARKHLEDLFSAAVAGRARLLMSAINAGEVHYILRKRPALALAEDWRALSRSLPVTLEVPTLDDIWNAAALKGQFAISYADAFAAGLAHKYDCPLVTGDKDFRRVANLELDWLTR